MGERELILDGMSVDDVMRIVGAAASGAAASGAAASGAAASNAAAMPAAASERSAPAAPREERVPMHDERTTPPEGTSDWREVLRSTGSAPSSRAAVPSLASPPPAGALQHEGPPDLEAPPPDEPPEDAVTQPPAAPTRTPDPAVAPPATGEPGPGIVVGAPSHELFTGPLGSLATLDEIADVVAKCTRCPLYKTATKPVPGQGSPNAELVCVGEAPGENEDKTGLAFVGAAGQLLTKILAAINLSREDVFICNVLKHRPPGNRNPSPQEVEACSPYLVRQLEIIRPKVIVAFGTFAAQTLLGTTLSIGKLRGSVHRYHGIPLVVTYHPAALLRNPAWKRPTWEDVQLARRVLDRAAGA